MVIIGRMRGRIEIGGMEYWKQDSELGDAM